ncbi:hypothetical protein NKH10_19410 [Mesorhizobium sp. M1340]|uniref:hypothetical protein n=1 Tax=Mesorhizobium sp. M1340 TaxID=2957087 RepID=UPI0033395FCC
MTGGKRIPPATLRALKALDAAPEKKMTYNEFRKASGVKTRAYYPFVNRLLDQRLIGPHGDNRADVGYTITFAGMQALLRAGEP